MAGSSATSPLIARFGQFSINAADMVQALNAPLLTSEERGTIREAVAISAAGDDGSRFTADPTALVFGEPNVAVLGLDNLLCITSNAMRAGMSEGVAAIRREIEAAAATGDQKATDALECLDYVQAPH